MKTFIILQSLVFFIYIVGIWAIFGVQKSISQTYYTLNENLKNSGVIFIIWLWLWLFPLFVFAPNDWFRVAVMVEAFVGAAAAFKMSNLSKNVHNISSYAGILVAQVGVGIMLGRMWFVLYPVCFLAISAGLKFGGVKNFIWWAEIIAFLSIFIPLFII